MPAPASQGLTAPRVSAQYGGPLTDLEPVTPPQFLTPSHCAVNARKCGFLAAVVQGSAPRSPLTR